MPNPVGRLILIEYMKSRQSNREAILLHLRRTYPDYEEKELYAKIICGEVKVNGETIRDPLRFIQSDSEIRLEGRRFVSRGGYKLEHALKSWQIDVSEKIFIDAGSSTGGFTDCLLQHGAQFVHAVDVGYNQLDFSLRKHPKVQVHEKTNIRALSEINPIPDAAVMDISFSSITGVIQHLLSLTKEKWAVVLLKPQFEAAGAVESFDGIVKDRQDVFRIIKNVIYKLLEQDIFITNMILSPIKGRKGNIETLIRVNLSESGYHTVLLSDLKSQLDNV
jgi:23S rRNA (cytidine1920-2'-O)/16S rRNA (cytidine1409-2'-O)-methyltransferase